MKIDIKTHIIMKTLFLFIAGMLFFIGNIYSQYPENSIRMIAREHMVENKEMIPSAIIDTPNNRMLTVYDFKNRVYIDDMNSLVPLNDSLSYYKVQSFGPYTAMHFMFVKDGKWMFVSTRGSLPQVMAKGVEACEELNLDFHESLYVFKEILTYKELYYDGNLEDVIIE